MRSGCDQPEIRHTTRQFSPSEGDINEFLGSSAAVVSGGLGFNSRIAVFVFLFLFGFCVFLFLFWSWVLGSNPVQCASWCFVFVVVFDSFLGDLRCRPGFHPNSKPAKRAAVVSGGLGFNSWIAVLVFLFLFGFACFSFCVGLGFKSRPVRFVVFCVCDVSNIVFWRFRCRPGVHPRSG